MLNFAFQLSFHNQRYVAGREFYYQVVNEFFDLTPTQLQQLLPTKTSATTVWRSENVSFVINIKSIYKISSCIYKISSIKDTWKQKEKKENTEFLHAYL